MPRTLLAVSALIVALAPPIVSTRAAAPSAGGRPTAQTCTTASLPLTAFHSGSQLAYVRAITTTRDLSATNIYDVNTPNEFGEDGWLGGCRQRVLFSQASGPHGPVHVMNVEIDVFATETGARTAYAWIADVGTLFQKDSVNQQGTPSIVYSDAGSDDGHGRSFGVAYDAMRVGNTITAAEAFTNTTSWKLPVVESARHQMIAESVALAPAARSALLRARSIGLFAPQHTGLAIDVAGTATSWHFTLDRVVRAHSIGEQTAKQGTYLVAILTVTNMGRSPASLTMDATFSIHDDYRRTYSENTDVETAAASVYSLDDLYSQVQPTFKAHVALGFNIPTSAVALHLMADPPSDSANSEVQLLPLGY